MKLIKKLFYSAIFLIPVLGFSIAAKANIGDFVNTPDSIEGLLNNVPWASTLLPGSIGALLCDIRKLFCPGPLITTIAATAIFVLGLMVINQKLKWPYAILIIGFILILANPRPLAHHLVSNAFFGINLGGGFGNFLDICVCGSDITGLFNGGSNPPAGDPNAGQDGSSTSGSTPPSNSSSGGMFEEYPVDYEPGPVGPGGSSSGPFDAEAEAEQNFSND